MLGRNASLSEAEGPWTWQQKAATKLLVQVRQKHPGEIDGRRQPAVGNYQHKNELEFEAKSTSSMITHFRSPSSCMVRRNIYHLQCINNGQQPVKRLSFHSQRQRNRHSNNTESCLSLFMRRFLSVISKLPILQRQCFRQVWPLPNRKYSETHSPAPTIAEQLALGRVFETTLVSK
jgi:hypothetical protein